MAGMVEDRWAIVEDRKEDGVYTGAVWQEADTGSMVENYEISGQGSGKAEVQEGKS